MTTYPPDYQAALSGAALFDLSDRGKIEVAGRDAREFLHNLSTQDIKNLPVGETCEAFLTTNKARVIVHVWITSREKDLFWLDMVAGQADKVLQHVNHYLISEQVDLTDRSNEFGLLELVGEKAAELSDKLGAKAQRMQRHRRLAVDAFDFYSPRQELPVLRQLLLDSGALVGSPTTYHILRIEAGLPEYGLDIDENRLAMEVNRPQAMSYNKGCYLGQETIVMARDRGQVNRLLMGFKAGAGAPLAAGTKLLRGNDEVGQVTLSVFSPRLGQVIALAYLRRGSWDAGTEVATAEGRSGTVCALPFCGGDVSTLP
jgi:folate-binding protein YgfZ